MNIGELTEKLSALVKDGHKEENVVITVEEPSVGARACVGIQSALLGFDWETGQLRIEPQEPLVTYGKDRDIPVKAKIMTMDMGRVTRSARKCPSCGFRVYKEHRYCPMCGQRIISELEERQQKEKQKRGIKDE